MLDLKNVTIRKKENLLINNCNITIPSQSIIVAKNEVNTEIIARAFAGFYPVTDGEIHLNESLINKKQNSSNLFFLILDSYYKIWKNCKISDISRMIKRKFNIEESSIGRKYNIISQYSIDSLTQFQRLIYLIALGQSLKRSVFIFDQPTKYFDYEDMELFFRFLEQDFIRTNYIIFTNRFGIFENLQVPIYQINNKTIILKGAFL